MSAPKPYIHPALFWTILILAGAVISGGIGRIVFLVLEWQKR